MNCYWKKLQRWKMCIVMMWESAWWMDDSKKKIICIFMKFFQVFHWILLKLRKLLFLRWNFICKLQLQEDTIIIRQYSVNFNEFFDKLLHKSIHPWNWNQNRRALTLMRFFVFWPKNFNDPFLTTSHFNYVNVQYLNFLRYSHQIKPITDIQKRIELTKFP